MRITDSMLIGNMSYNLNQTLNRMEKLQYQSTGKKFRVPSDDPIGSSKALRIRTNLSKLSQYKRNVEDARSWMNETEGALNEINEILHRANELTNQAATETYSEDDLEKMKQEMAELRKSLIKVANTTYSDRSIFTGYKTESKLLDDDGNYIVGLEAEYKIDIKDINGESLGTKDIEFSQFGDAYYLEEGQAVPILKDDGSVLTKEDLEDPKNLKDLNIKEYTGVVQYKTGQEETVDVNSLGHKIFGRVDKTENKTSSPDYLTPTKAGEKAYLIQMFDEIETALEDRDTLRLQEGLEDIKNARGNILSEIAKVGTKVSRLNITEEKLEDQTVNSTELLSQVEDSNIPEVYMQLMLEKNVYNASLSIGAQIIQPSLADFIR